MPNFDLTHYKADSSSVETTPTWVLNGSETTKKLYKIVITEIEKIRDNIQTNKVIKEKQKKIIKSKIADLANVDKSLISERRESDINSLINSENAKLAALCKYSTQKNRQGRKNTNSELTQKLEALKIKYKELEQANYRQYLESQIDNEILTEQKILREKFERLNKEHRLLIEKHANLQLTNQRLLEALNCKTADQ